MTEHEIEEIKKAMIDLSGWDHVPQSVSSRAIARLRALLPAPETLEAACEELVTRWDDEIRDRIRVALERRKKETK